MLIIMTGQGIYSYLKDFTVPLFQARKLTLRKIKRDSNPGLVPGSQTQVFPPFPHPFTFPVYSVTSQLTVSTWS